MRYQKQLLWLIPLIFILALFAASASVFYQTSGQPYEFTSHRGETVTINGRGVYANDTVSMAAQQQGNDMVTLAVGLPLLAISTWLAFRGSLRGRLLLIGTLGFFLYTYTSMAMLTSYNALFLVYVALFTLSLYAFILSMLSFNVRELPTHFSDRLPRRWIAGLLFFVGGFLVLAWLGRIVPPLFDGTLPALENTTTLVIQAMDLALVAPLAILAGVLLLQKNPWGYLLASVALMKGITMGLAVSSMAVNMALRGVPEELGIMVPFLAITTLNLLHGGPAAQEC
ncbi:MAG: hypothetical protein P1P76_05255 [Anaerolineales bacterium]|nr:hypothetical protein [Anaerolineales bacterium]